MNAKFYGMLGLAMRAGRLIVGEEGALKQVKSGTLPLLLLATDASSNTEKRFLDKTAFYHVPLLRYGTGEELGSAVGKKIAVVLAVTDVGFAEQLCRLATEENE